MIKLVFSFLFAVVSVATLPAAVTIAVTNQTPNGSASGGSGSGPGALTTSLGTIGTDNGMPSTTYTLLGLDLTSVGGTASESFIFQVIYTATTDGTTAGNPQFNGFGNVSVTGGASASQVEGSETLTATISLTSSTFSGLSLTGFATARAGGVSGTEMGTFTHAGGTANITSGVIANRQFPITGNSVTLSVTNGQMNLEGFTAQFVAVPEPGSASLLAVAAIAMLRRRRSA